MAAYGRLVHFMRTGRFPRDPWWVAGEYYYFDFTPVPKTDAP